MNNPSMRARYIADTVATASPGKLLVMLYDRLVLDLTRAEEALGGGDREGAAQQLMHAQDIIIELRSSLKTDVWDGAPGLSELYGFLLTQLIQANVRGDAELVVSCRSMIEPLRDAWRTAVAEAGSLASAARVA
ncbi:flagellar export chaperone FliS [Planomonospora sp. ID67723]|uniref:flagellar export chaperone FliS n=1 Tax=Planomonospora sp. ID67723 TaxID=2738134 RepID=UPI0018C395DA|nr:flagellar export chaperone FliS [Planomonospora sp. ID67723]MBG0833237.1 flagellar export chaperone FliS [Planomonospora sp. ID67723]